MNEPIIFKQSAKIGQFALFQWLMPPLVAIATLYGLTHAYDVHFDREFRVLAVLLAILCPLVLKRPQLVWLETLPQCLSVAISLLLRWLVLLALLLAIGYVTGMSEEYSRRVILTWAIVAPLPLVLLAAVLNEYTRRLVAAPGNARVAVVAGYAPGSVELVKRIRANQDLGIRIAGFFDDRSSERLSLPPGKQLLGGLGELATYVNAHNVDVIFIALPMRQLQRVMDLLDELRDTTASIYYVPDIFVTDLIQSRTADIFGIPVVALCETPFHGSRGAVKRLMDVSITLLALMLTAPLLLLVAVLIKLDSPGPVIFRQRRYGLDGEVINIYKFRTMTVTEDGPMIRQATVGDARITTVGRVLRRYSIDELPQFFNVLQGDMSLVGPRPHAVAHNEQYRGLIKGYMIRHKVRPGITGLAQVNGCRGETSSLQQMEARVEYDLDYLRHWSPELDIGIMLRTAIMVLRDRKAY